MRPLLIALLFTFFFTIQVTDVCASDVGIDVGKSAPPFELRDLSGKIITLADYKGSVVLLNFWSTLCAPCTAEMPSLNRLHEALKDRGVIVLAVAIDASDKPVRDFTTNNKLSLVVLLDKDKEVFFDQYAGPGLPTTYLIDRDGVIVEKFSGEKEWDTPEMKKRIVKLLIKR